MNRILLTSSSFSNEVIYDFLKDKVKEMGYKKAAIVTTAHPEKEKSHWNKETKIELEEMGLSVVYVDLEKGEIVADVDVVYVCGGNTYHLLHYARQNDFASSLRDLFEKGGLYMGSSAGSIILSPTLASVVADESAYRDRNRIGMTDFTALNFVDFNLLVHFEDNERDTLEKIKEYSNHKTYTLRNGEAIYVDGKNIHCIH